MCNKIIVVVLSRGNLENKYFIRRPSTEAGLVGCGLCWLAGETTVNKVDNVCLRVCGAQSASVLMMI